MPKTLYYFCFLAAHAELKVSGVFLFQIRVVGMELIRGDVAAALGCSSIASMPLFDRRSTIDVHATGNYDGK